MKISIIIIGYNSSKSLKKVLGSLNQLIINNEVIEIIYVDDGSLDRSVETFKKFNLKFKKIYFAFSKNKGRVFARTKAISLASGNWLLFIQSNVLVDPKLVVEYHKAISVKGVVAIAGKIVYQSKDSVFENYLNDKKRGVNNFKNHSLIPFRSLLFGNCIIKKEVFDLVKFNPVFKTYGGKELDFAQKLCSHFPNSIITSRNAIVTRVEFPNFKKHCQRLIEYGGNNFICLSDELKAEVIKWRCLLYKNIFFVFIFSFIYCAAIRFYGINFFSYHIIRLGMLSAILRGYYQAK